MNYEAQKALIQAYNEISALIGFEDLRDWFGMIFMYFSLGPIFIPLLWMPIALMIIGAYATPALYYNPPSGSPPFGRSLTTNVSVGRSMRNMEELENDSSEEESHCWDMFACEMDKVFKSSKVLSWITR